MCVIVIKSKKTKIEYETSLACWNTNPDGGGVCWIKNGRFVVQKFFDHDALWNAINANQHRAMLIHYRIKTHGAIDEKNTHPHIINKDLVFAHNGIIHNIETKHGESDTLALRDLMREFPKQWLADANWITMLSGYIGEGNKLAIMTRHGRVVEIGQFHDHKGLRVSNTYFTTPKQKWVDRWAWRDDYDVLEWPEIDKPRKTALLPLNDDQNGLEGNIGDFNTLDDWYFDLIDRQEDLDREFAEYDQAVKDASDQDLAKWERMQS